ncbi:lichenan operon transcriptional antiterminator [Pelagirhabdus alkalitolerans]|uniref:Lichenan operon transcriptional antiterminator n=1 Tax=Pelagirhabdus alkalitolerans TaxID=1612202 RepID=A0A1G6KJJ9_9BACI|nr:BglG family transcription antiterminator [Pelagirhabdus alkalitolerans]SDC31292.1 lichenan operon transcriptional antiterminator [Pelagirhabdus alkalitolerans]
MNTRQQHLLKKLMGEDQPITGSELAKYIQVTSRTVRNDLKEIDHLLKNQDAGASIESIRGQGYQLEVIDESQFKGFIKIMLESEESVPVEPEDRVHYLAKRFLLTSNYLKIDDLADELFVSRSTLQNDLKDVKVILKKYNLQLCKRPNYGLVLSGNEKQIRYAISELLFNRTTITSPESNQEDWLLPVDQMEVIKSIVLNQLKAVELNLSDIALNNLVVHIAIACRRIESGQYVQLMRADEDDIKSKREYKVAQSIIKEIENALSIQFPVVEISYVAMHLLGTKLFLNEENKELKQHLDDSILATVDKMVKRVESQMKLGITEDKELYAGIAIHLKPAIHRYKHQMTIRNPMIEAIKVNYPVAFEAGVTASKVVEEDYGIEVDEHEIGYIALHFGAAIERTKLQTKPKRCLIVCTTGLGSSQLLLYKMKAKFGNQLTIVGTTELHNLSNYNKETIDFIVSTVPLPDSIDIPHVVISTLLGDSEIDDIQDMIDYNYSSIVDQYLIDDLIYLNLSFQKPSEVITFLGEELINKGYTEHGLIESVMAREKAASTSYGNLVAIPHPLEAKSDKTFWTVATLKEPIDWCGNPVQFICLLHVADENSQSLEPMYNTLIRFMDNRKLIDELLQTNDKKEVKELLKRM